MTIRNLWLGLGAFSLTIHVGGLTALSTMYEAKPKRTFAKVKVKVAEAKVAPKIEETPEPLPPKPKPKPKKKKKQPKKPKARHLNSKQEKQPKKKVQPVQGLTKDSFVKDGKSTVAAPVGNNLLSEDKGIRLRPEEVAQLTEDLSADAQLIRNTLAVPEYTELAIDAGLEGRYILDVFVTAKGEVRAVEFRKKIGYGMDDRVRVAVMSAKFIPRKNAVGTPLEGWVELPINFILP